MTKRGAFVFNRREEEIKEDSTQVLPTRSLLKNAKRSCG